MFGSSNLGLHKLHAVLAQAYSLITAHTNLDNPSQEACTQYMQFS